MIRQVMESANLTIWPIFSLILFMASSAAMIFWLWRQGSTETYRLLANVVFDENSEKNNHANQHLSGGETHE